MVRGFYNQNDTTFPMIMETETDKKNPGGRPLKFKTVKLLQKEIDAYFAECDPHVAERPALVFQKDSSGTILNNLPKVPGKEHYVTDQIAYTVTGLALALDTTRETLMDYQRSDKYSDTILRAKLKILNFSERSLFTSKNTNGIQFSMKNNFNWKDKTEVEKSGTPDVAVVNIVNYADIKDEDI